MTQIKSIFPSLHRYEISLLEKKALISSSSVENWQEFIHIWRANESYKGLNLGCPEADLKDLYLRNAPVNYRVEGAIDIVHCLAADLWELLGRWYSNILVTGFTKLLFLKNMTIIRSEHPQLQGSILCSKTQWNEVMIELGVVTIEMMFLDCPLLNFLLIISANFTV